ncbi:MAG: hypothetical protein SGCHY_003353 [Lobulomycetales sp.]
MKLSVLLMAMYILSYNWDHSLLILISRLLFSAAVAPTWAVLAVNSVFALIHQLKYL